MALAWVLGMLILGPVGARAQSGCLLTPVPLAERVQLATRVVEAQIVEQRAELWPGGRIGTRSTLRVFAVLKGPAASSLELLTPGGTVGRRREVVSGSLTPAPGQQGIFLLEPDPEHPGALRLAAGPQGLLAYDLGTLTATDPFARYPAIGAGLYPTLAVLTNQTARPVQPNTGLEAARARAAQTAAHRPAATPSISSLSPTALPAGTNTVTTPSNPGILTINGSGFNASRGTGYVAFRNADNGGAGATQPLAGDYLAWSDTQIRVRVPSNSASGNTAGTGPVTVVNSDGSAGSSASLTVTYALTNIDDSGQNYRIGLVGPGGTANPGGYVLRYTASAAAGTAVPAAARTAFETALATWACQGGANRVIGSIDASQTQANQDGVNLVSFGALPAGVLGVTSSYYSGCFSGGTLYWVLTETDYTFSNSADFYYGTGTPGGGQSDFQSVALHEQGHGIQLGHIISSTGVMNFALTTGTTRRTLDAGTDLAAASDETSYSTSATAAQRCSFAAYAATSACPLPVELVAFTARYAPGQGTRLNWSTASELDAAYFAVESQEAGINTWQELTRQPAAGHSTSLRHYQAQDARPVAGLRYFRLRQVDQDGTVAYSSAVAVQGEAGALSAYPNPATGLVHLRGPLAPAGRARVQLLDALGRPVRTATGPTDQPAFDLPLTNLPAGFYVLTWDGGTGVQRLRLTVE
ncbi:hypothetical protein [Hymenobacter jeollabukensis]|uniref:T9SS type A sorting domain-containing protein n=1 Tax=Hymenobacter jeollabukensis TaxID=2025313 RepID=A0A5R8WWF1_9BACT|nr:hypothetical protein [Hymenobacter jeollabukensis]TLM96857.1 hypothetical protein FDY95_02375 [Hymenobacter jeollabukensis]